MEIILSWTYDNDGMLKELIGYGEKGEYVDLNIVIGKRIKKLDTCYDDILLVLEE